MASAQIPALIAPDTSNARDVPLRPDAGASRSTSASATAPITPIPTPLSTTPIDDTNQLPAPGAEESEVQLLERAQTALTTDPALALELTERHLKRFGMGPLGQEREVIAIDALLRLGQVALADLRTSRFQLLYPESAYEQRIQKLFERMKRAPDSQKTAKPWAPTR